LVTEAKKLDGWRIIWLKNSRIFPKEPSKRSQTQRISRQGGRGKEGRDIEICCKQGQYALGELPSVVDAAAAVGLEEAPVPELLIIIIISSSSRRRQEG
jgi:hypothetical protein